MKELTSIKELSLLNKSGKGQTHDDSLEGRGSHMTTQSHMSCHVKIALQRTLIVIRPASIPAFPHLIKAYQRTVDLMLQKNSWHAMKCVCPTFMIHYVLQECDILWSLFSI